MNCLILKIACLDETRRILLDSTPDFESLENMIRRIWPDCAAHMTEYTNNKGDRCTLAENTFSDFLSTANKEGGDNSHGVLKLQVPDGQRLMVQNHFAEPVVSVGAPSTSAADGTDTESPRSESSWHRLDWEGGSNSEALSVVDNDEDEWVEAADLADDSAGQVALEVPTDVACESASSGWATLAEDIAPPSEQRAARRIQLALHRYHRRHHSSTPAALPADSEVQQQVDAAERVYMILAAFDANEDEHLSFEEYNDLQGAACDCGMGQEVYDQLCGDFGGNPEIGLGKNALMGIYAELCTLDRDFAAAKQRLERFAPEADQSAPAGARETASSDHSDAGHWAFGLRMSPLSAAVAALSAARAR